VGVGVVCVWVGGCECWRGSRECGFSSGCGLDCGWVNA